MLASGFTGTPVSRVLFFGIIACSLLASITDTKYLFYINVVPHLWRYKQFWRLLAWQTCYTNSTELLFAAMSLYHMRIIERLWGSRKFVVRVPIVNTPRLVGNRRRRLLMLMNLPLVIRPLHSTSYPPPPAPHPCRRPSPLKLQPLEHPACRPYTLGFRFAGAVSCRHTSCLQISHPHFHILQLPSSKQHHPLRQIFDLPPRLPARLLLPPWLVDSGGYRLDGRCRLEEWFGPGDVGQMAGARMDLGRRKERGRRLWRAEKKAWRGVRKRDGSGREWGRRRSKTEGHWKRHLGSVQGEVLIQREKYVWIKNCIAMIPFCAWDLWPR